MKILIVIFLAIMSVACVSETEVGGVKPGNATELSSTPEAVDTGVFKTIQGEELAIMSKTYANNVCYIEPTPELKARLSPEEWNVLVEAGTEPPFMNEYWDNHEPGIYVDTIDGTALFASKTKFDSGTGWPSFWEPIDKNSLVLVEDLSYGMRRIEVRAKVSGGHLGHLFDDGPKPTGLRYCINSAALKFIPLEKLESEGYGHLKSLL